MWRAGSGVELSAKPLMRVFQVKMPGCRIWWNMWRAWDMGPERETMEKMKSLARSG